ncbi:starch-binding domain-containing protein 1 [Hyperolius riggenbachi]|uniref:starch-binding domain-containing protein 1 n=1 Tax=Hyperolius riggenbachi TaxID=752182 RepID=UPI0035A3B76C
MVQAAGAHQLCIAVQGKQLQGPSGRSNMWAVVVLGILTAVFAWVWFGGKGEKSEPESRDSVQDSQTRSNVESEPQASEDRDASIPDHQEVSQVNALQVGEGKESAQLTEEVIPPNFSEKAPDQVLHPRDTPESSKVLSTVPKVEDLSDTQAVDLKPSSVAEQESVQTSNKECHRFSQDKLQMGIELLETSKTTTQELQCTKELQQQIVFEKEAAQDSEADGKPEPATEDKLVNDGKTHPSIVSVTHEVKEFVNDLRTPCTSDQPLTATERKVVNDQEVHSLVVPDSQEVSDQKAPCTSGQPLLAVENEVVNGEVHSSVVPGSLEVADLKEPCTSGQPLPAAENKVVNDSEVQSSIVPDSQEVSDLKAPCTSCQPLPATENKVVIDRESQSSTVPDSPAVSDLKAPFTSSQPLTAAENKVEDDWEVKPSIVAGTQEVSDLKASCTSVQHLTATDNKLVNKEVHPCIVKATEEVTVDDITALATTNKPISSTENKLVNDNEDQLMVSTTEEVKASVEHVMPCGGTIVDCLGQTSEELVKLKVEHGTLLHVNVQELVETHGDLVNHSTFLENAEAIGKQVCSTHSSEKENLLLEDVIHPTDVPDAVEVTNGGEEIKVCAQEENVAAFLQEHSKDTSVLTSAGAVEDAALEDSRPHEKHTDSASPAEVLSSKEDIPEDHACVKSEACEQLDIDFSVNDLLATEEATTNSLSVAITDGPSTETDNVTSKDLHEGLSNIHLLDVILSASNASLPDDAPPLNTSTKEYPDFQESCLGEKASCAGHTDAKPHDDAQKTKRVAAVHPMPQTVNLGFKVHYITPSDGQIIAITGDHEKLGGWEVCVPLNPDKDGFWSSSIAFPVDASLEWKFVVLENGKVKRWEECDNRYIRTTHEDIIAQQWWGYP